MFKSKAQRIESYAQSGEDLVIDFVLSNHLQVDKPNYLDIGANEPVKFSNTYKFYNKGYSGVLVEPDPVLAVQNKKAMDRM